MIRSRSSAHDMRFDRPNASRPPKRGPDETGRFALLRDQIEAARWHQASETAQTLLSSLLSNGLPPRITGCDRVDRLITESLCRTVASWELIPEGRRP